MKSALQHLRAAKVKSDEAGVPKVSSFRDFLVNHARVPVRAGEYGPFSFKGRAPLEWIVTIIDKVLSNCLEDKAVEIDGVKFAAGELRGTTLTIGGGAQWGKTVLVLNLQGYITFIEMLNFGYYTPDQQLLGKIVSSKFRPDLLDQHPWMARMIKLARTETASGKAVDRNESYQAINGGKKSFGFFSGLQKPTTSITLDVAALDEVDDIPAKNMGYVDGRMTGSPVRLKIEIGTQRIAGAGQNARVEQGTFHRLMTPCHNCKQEWNLEENFPRIIRVAAADGKPRPEDPQLKPEMGHDRSANYYFACPECGAELNRDEGKYVARYPGKIPAAHFSIRVSQFACSAISMQEIVGTWFASLLDPSGNAMIAWNCDRQAIPNAGAAQPITQQILDRSRQDYAMSLAAGTGMGRFAGLDTGPRCWFWCDEKHNDFTSQLAWAELIASGNVRTRVPLLMEQLGVSCLFADAGGEPDLTKWLCLELNGLHDFKPPVVTRAELQRMQFSFGNNIAWDGERGRWSGIRCAAVQFVSGEAKGIEQTLGLTQDGKVYPLIKCNRAESIQTAVNDFLTPAEGVIEIVVADGKKVRTDPRARLPKTYIGTGVSQAVLDGHLLNLRRVRDTKTGAEDWVDGVENHLGLAKVYARLAATQAVQQRMVAGRIVVSTTSKRSRVLAARHERSLT
jgi:hypothetical protein